MLRSAEPSFQGRRARAGLGKCVSAVIHDLLGPGCCDAARFVRRLPRRSGGAIDALHTAVRHLSAPHSILRILLTKVTISGEFERRVGDRLSGPESDTQSERSRQAAYAQSAAQRTAESTIESTTKGDHRNALTSAALRSRMSPAVNRRRRRGRGPVYWAGLSMPGCFDIHRRSVEFLTGTSMQTSMRLNSASTGKSTGGGVTTD